jgi:hypothetical protein
MKKVIISLVLLICASLSSTEQEKEPTNSQNCIDQQIDTSDWVAFPMTHGWFIEGQSSGEEHIEVSFPTYPQYMEETASQPAYFTADDEEGMTFRIASMPLSEKDFNLRENVDRMANLISQSPNKRLFAITYPTFGDSGFKMSWIQDDQLTNEIFIKSDHFIYVLETTDKNEIYRDAELGSEAFNLILKSLLKTGAFSKSFVLKS